MEDIYQVEEGRGTAEELKNTIEALERNCCEIRQLTARHMGMLKLGTAPLIVWTVVFRKVGNGS